MADVLAFPKKPDQAIISLADRLAVAVEGYQDNKIVAAAIGLAAIHAVGLGMSDAALTKSFSKSLRAARVVLGGPK